MHDECMFVCRCVSLHLPALGGGFAALLHADGEADEGVGAADEGDVVDRPVEAGEVLRGY